MNWPTNDAFSPIFSAFGAFVGGGPRVQVTENGRITQDFFAYEPEFRGGVLVSLRDLDHDGDMELIANPGQGGGPRERIWELTPEFKLVSDKFVGDPDSRNPVQTNRNIEVSTPEPLIPVPDSMLWDMTTIPGYIRRDLVATGFQVITTGESVADLYPHLHGVETTEVGDGTRTYDNVRSFLLENAVYVDDPLALLHEIGHKIDRLFPVDIPVQTDYVRLNPGELRAESFRIAVKTGVL